MSGGGERGGGGRGGERRWRRRVEAVALPLGAAVVVVALWQVAVQLSHTKVFPPPAAVLRAFGELARRGVLLGYIRDSLFRVGSVRCV